jgi:50S ribosomal protein L16 3-hydroxylase
MLSAAFWPSFAAGHFGRQPFAASDPPVSLDFGAPEFFELMLRSCRSAGTGAKDAQVRLFIAQREVHEDLGQHLPRPADGSLDGFLARMDTELAGQSYLLMVQRAHVVSRELWKRAAGFLAGLYEATGLLPGDAEVEAFVGRYPYTPTGIHRERSGVFVSAVHGRKDMYVWPSDAAGLPLRSGHYDQARASATRLRCAPGRLVYWPAMHWHVGESPQPSAALHVTVAEQPPGQAALLAAAIGKVASGPAKGIATGSAGLGDGSLPAQYEELARALTAACGDIGAVRDRLMADWLRRRTGLGFTAPPPRRGPVELGEHDVVARDSQFPIALVARDARTSWCAADGRVARIRSAPALSAAIDLLNSGEPVPVGVLLSLATSELELELLRGAVALLADWQVLTVARSQQ